MSLRAASDAALVARYDALVLALRGGELTALADIGPVARELRRRGLDSARRNGPKCQRRR